ncbi:MAG TPA: hypothetical protein VFY29_15200, partial [Terriglobia bacterium]|nr:hypothetical protein [Terriglobia bacterium]
MRRTIPLVGLLFAFSVPLAAHDSRPILVEISELGNGRYTVQWKVPTSLPPAEAPDVVLPEDCAQQGTGFNTSSETALLRRRTFECAQPLTNRAIQLRYPLLNPSLSALFRMKASSGETYTRLLGPDEL